MIDRLILRFWHPHVYQITNPQAFANPLYGYGINWNVSYTKDVAAGYYPTVVLNKYKQDYPPYLTQKVLKVSCSLPKIVYGNNLFELEDLDLTTVCSVLSDKLNQMGVSLSPNYISTVTDIASIEYGKNFYTGHIPVNFILQELYRAHPLNSYMDVSRIKFCNGGEELVFYSPGYEVVFYDKAKELKKELAYRKCVLPDKLADEIRQDKFNVFRMEVRFHNSTVRTAAFKEIGISEEYNASLQQLFSRTVSRKVLNYYWQRISRTARLVPLSCFTPAYELQGMYHGAGKRLKPQQLLARLGMHCLLRECGYKATRETLQRIGSSNPAGFIKQNVGPTWKLTNKLDIWRFFDRALSRFKCMKEKCWKRANRRLSAPYFKHTEPMLSISVVAKILNVENKVVRSEIKRGVLRAKKIGIRRCRVSRQALAEYLQDSEP